MSGAQVSFGVSTERRSMHLLGRNTWTLPRATCLFCHTSAKRKKYNLYVSISLAYSLRAEGVLFTPLTRVSRVTCSRSSSGAPVSRLPSAEERVRAAGRREERRVSARRRHRIDLPHLGRRELPAEGACRRAQPLSTRAAARVARAPTWVRGRGRGRGRARGRGRGRARLG